LTLTVPEAALTDTVAFSIQPVINKFDGGLGLGYKLEPRGRDFTSPLDISIRYDDHDLEGTFPDALSLAYQDDKGAWHMQNQVDLDRDNKTITIATTHFSVWELDSKLKVSPLKATVRVGEKVNLSLTHCDERAVNGAFNKFIDLTDRLVNGESHPCQPGWWPNDRWQLTGAGDIVQAWPTIIYTAPGKKPSPNTVTVVFYDPDFMVSVERPCTKSDHNIGLSGKNSTKIWTHKCYDRVPSPESLKAVITIVDGGYRASGSDASTSYSGTVCGLDKPFTVTANNTLVQYPLNFTPSTGTAGTVNYSATWGPLRLTGNGTYVVEGLETDKPRIVVTQAKSTLTGPPRSATGTGPAHIDLTPLDSNECDASSNSGVSSGVKQTLATQ
jgi:hypothetical protein